MSEMMEEIGLFFELSVDMLCIVNFDGYFKLISPAWSQVLGWSNEEIMATPFINFVHEDDVESTIRTTESCLKKEAVLTFQNRYRCKDGSYKWIEWKSITHMKKSIIIAVARDITEKIVTEQILLSAKDAAEKARDLLENRNQQLTFLKNILEEEKDFVSRVMEIIPIAIVVLDKTGKITYANSYAENVLGVEADKANRKYNSPEWKTITLDGKPFPEEEEPFVQVMTTKKPVYDICQGIETGDGKIRFLSINGNPQLNLNGEVEWIAFSLQDITARVVYEENLNIAKEIAEKLSEDAELANKAKSKFLSSMSHEMKTPLNGILGFSEILYNEISDKRHKDLSKSINNSGKALLDIINDMLDLAKIESSIMEQKIDTVSLRSVINEIEKILRQGLGINKIDFKLNIDDNIPDLLRLDETFLKKVIIKIANISLKSIHDGTIKLGISSFESDTNSSNTINLKLFIEDSGNGIPENVIEKIFEDFWQDSDDKLRKYSSAGIGLSISKKMIQMMGGTINVTKNINSGNTFEIVLPNIEFVQQNMENKAKKNLQSSSISMEKAKILVVDDTESNCYYLKMLLEGNGLEVYIANNGLKGVSLAKEKLPNLILMDINMPVMDGIEANKLIKEDNETKYIPVIALTASSDTNDFEGMFDGLLSKPISAIHLFNELNKFFISKDSDEKLSISGSAAEVISKDVVEKLVLGEDVLLELESDIKPLVERLDKSLKISDVKKLLISLEDISNKHKLGRDFLNINNLREDMEVLDINNIKNYIKNLLEEFNNKM